MMGERHVRHLRLEAPSETLLGRGVTLIEDALRTASLPEASGGRLYVVRRFNLGPIDPARPAGVVAQTIERRFAELRMGAVHAGAPNARHNSVVYFHDAVEPFILLAKRVVASALPDEWFWPLVVPGHALGRTWNEVLRLALTGAMSTRYRGAAIVELVLSLDDGELDALCGALRRIDGEVLFTILPKPSAAPLSIEDFTVPMVRPGRQEVVARWMAYWGTADPRTLWLAAMTVCSVAPTIVSHPALLRCASLLVSAWTAPRKADSMRSEPSQGETQHRTPESTERIPHHPQTAAAMAAPPDRAILAAETVQARTASTELAGSTHEHRPTLPVANPADFRAGSPMDSKSESAESARENSLTTNGDSALESAWVLGSHRYRASAPAPITSFLPNANGVATGRQAAAPQRQMPRCAPWGGSPLPTAAGGLLFLVRPLARLGFGDWLEANPNAAAKGIAASLLRYIAMRVGVASNDPGLSPWATPDATAPVDGEQAVVHAWCIRLAQWARRHPRLSLRMIVCRPAHVIATRTHVDVIFAALDADVRLRAAGLDFDPGWVPWLGRIIQFHFTDAPLRSPLVAYE